MKTVVVRGKIIVYRKSFGKANLKRNLFSYFGKPFKSNPASMESRQPDRKDVPRLFPFNFFLRFRKAPEPQIIEYGKNLYNLLGLVFI